MAKIGYVVRGLRAPSEASEDKRPIPSAVAPAPSRRGSIIERVELHGVPLPRHVVRDWFGEPHALNQAARLTQNLTTGLTLIRPIGKRRHNLERFACGDYFIKMGLGHQELRVGREAIAARWAGERGWAPKVIQTPGVPGTLVAQWVGGAPPHADALMQAPMRTQLLALMRALHASRPLFRRDKDQDAIGVAGYARMRRSGLQSQHRALCDLQQLQARMEWLLPQLELPARQWLFCHFEPNAAHLREHEGHMVLLGWEQARFADPLRDLARLFGECELGPDDVGLLLGEYLGASLQKQHETRFAMWLQALALDDYCTSLRSTSSTSQQRQAIRRRIQNSERLVPDLPPLPWQERKQAIFARFTR